MQFSHCFFFYRLSTVKNCVADEKFYVAKSFHREFSKREKSNNLCVHVCAVECGKYEVVAAAAAVFPTTGRRSKN